MHCADNNIIVACDFNTALRINEVEISDSELILQQEYKFFCNLCKEKSKDLMKILIIFFSFWT